jgi:hypothetical protein
MDVVRFDIVLVEEENKFAKYLVQMGDSVQSCRRWILIVQSPFNNTFPPIRFVSCWLRELFSSAEQIAKGLET